MGVLQEFERRLEGAVEGFFARAFRSGVQPVELAKAVQRYAEDNQHVTADGVVVPNVYRVTVGTKDHERLQGFGASLPRELGEVIVSTAAERGWQLRGPAKVRVAVDEDVRYGRFRLTGRVEAVDEKPTRGQGDRHMDAPPVSHLDQPGRGATPVGAPAPGTSAAPSTPFGPPSPEHGDDHAADHPQRAPEPASGTSGFDHTQIITEGPSAGAHVVLERSRAGSSARLPLVGSRLTAGRLDGCDLTIDDPTVSREHAAFVHRADRWWVVDLGSTNGTSVNGRRAAEHPLEDGDEVALGDAILRFVGG